MDSSVAAFLLKEQGYGVTGVFMKVWDKKEKDVFAGPACYSPEGKDIGDAKEVADMLGIDLTVIDLSREYNKVVLDYFRREYLKGRTPNPCVICNRFIKFGLLFEKAVAGGRDFDFFATGHYAVAEYSREGKRYVLKKGRDADKDQSYFLFLLTQKQLSKLIFPLGPYTKKDIRAIARRNNFPVSEKEESQDFISGNKDLVFTDKSEEGDVVDTKGNLIGRHRGIIYYTIGQRKGLGIAGGKPLYVVEIDARNNIIMLGPEQDLYRKELIVSDVHFSGMQKPDSPVECEVKIRYRHAAARAVVYPESEGKARVVFDNPLRAITPGQAAVFYSKDLLLGGGFIERVLQEKGNSVP